MVVACLPTVIAASSKPPEATETNFAVVAYRACRKLPQNISKVGGMSLKALKFVVPGLDLAVYG